MIRKISKLGAMAMAAVMAVAVIGCSSPAPTTESEAPAEAASEADAASEAESAAESGTEAASEEASSSSEGTIKFGFYAPLTGPAASDGRSAQNAADLAVETINAKGGINGQQVELISYDDGMDTKQAVNIAQKLTTKDKVVAVVSGSYSGPTRVAAPIFQQAKTPMLSAYAIHPDVCKSGDFIFSQSFPGSVQGTAGAKIAVDNLMAKRISILAVDIDFGKTLSDAFTQYATAHGAEIVSVDNFAMADKEFAPVITKLKEQVKPDLIYMANYSAHGAEIVRQVKNLGLDVEILGTEGIDAVEFLDIAGENAEGVMITTNMNRDDDNPIVQDFIKAYTDKYGYAPDMVAASAYDAFEVLFHVISENGTDPEKIRDGIKGLKNFYTVTGELIEYAPSREAVKPIQIQKVTNGEYHFYDVITDEDIMRAPAE